jgi:hypothetical protein
MVYTLVEKLADTVAVITLQAGNELCPCMATVAKKELQLQEKKHSS